MDNSTLRVAALLSIATAVVMGALWFSQGSVGPVLTIWIGVLTVAQSLILWAIWRALLASRARRLQGRDGPITVNDWLQSLKSLFEWY